MIDEFGDEVEDPPVEDAPVEQDFSGSVEDTPPEEPTPEEPPRRSLDDARTEARLSGYGWDEINSFLSGGARTAIDEGYHPDEVNHFLGTGDASALDRRLADNAAVAADRSDNNDPSTGLVNWSKHETNPAEAFAGMPDENLRWEYMNALSWGEAGSPEDFAESYARAVGAPGIEPALAATLPSNEDLTDHAIAVLGLDGTEINPDTVRTTKANLLTNYAETGQTPQEAHEQAKDDPDAAFWLMTEKQREQFSRDFPLGTSVFGKPPADPDHPDAITNLGTDATVLAVSIFSPPVGLALAAYGVATLPEQIEQHDKRVEAAKAAGATPEQLSEIGWEHPGWGAAFNFALPAILGGKRFFEMAPEIAGAIPKLLHDESGISSLFRAVTREGEAASPGVHPLDAVVRDESGGDVHAVVGRPREGELPQEHVYEVEVPKQPDFEKIHAEEVAKAETARAEGREPEPARTLDQIIRDESEPLTIRGRDGAPAPTPEQALGHVVAGSLREELGSFLRGLWNDESGSLRLPNAFLSQEKQAFRARNDAARERGEPSVLATMGAANRTKAMASKALEGMRKEFNKTSDSWDEWLAKQGPTHSNYDYQTGHWDIHPNAVLIDHMEQRPGAPVRLNPNDPLMPIADTFRDLNKQVDALIQGTPGLAGQVGSIMDFWRHRWTNPAKAESLFSGKAGSTAGFKERSIPYHQDALDRGLKPAIPDPVDHMASDFVGKVDAVYSYRERAAAEAAGDLQWSAQGPPAPGMVRVQGPGTERGIGEKAYAYPGWAKAYNSQYGEGIHQKYPAFGPIYDKLQQFSNQTIGWLLGFPLFHTQTMVQESISAGLSSIAGQLPKGQIGRAFGSVGKTVVGQKIEGRQLRDAYLDPTAYPDLQHIVDLGEATNYRFAGRPKELVIGGDQIPGWVKMWQDGSMGKKLGENFGRIFHGTDPSEPGLTTAALAPFRTADAIGVEVGRLQNMTNHWLFEKVIPDLRNGAFLAEMKQFLHDNPLSSRTEQVAHARKVSDSIDNRFGELNQDNVFINKVGKQLLNLTSVSYGWTLGFHRLLRDGPAEILNGLRGAVTLNKYGDASDLLGVNARWLMTYPAAVAVTGAVYQYIKSGTAPGYYQNDQGTIPGEDGSLQRTLNNLMFPAGNMLAGYQKDFVKWGVAALQGGGNAIERSRRVAEVYAGAYINNPLSNIMKKLVTGKDWTDQSIANKLQALNHNVPVSAMSYLGYILSSSLLPIYFQQDRMAASNLNEGERVAGLRDAPKWAIDPEGYAASMLKVNAREMTDTARQLLAHEKKLAEPDDETIASLQDTIAQMSAVLKSGGGSSTGSGTTRSSSSGTGTTRSSDSGGRFIPSGGSSADYGERYDANGDRLISNRGGGRFIPSGGGGGAPNRRTPRAQTTDSTRSTNGGGRIISPETSGAASSGRFNTPSSRGSAARRPAARRSTRLPTTRRATRR